MKTPDPELDRWRGDARRALPDADVELVEEIALHLADTWKAARADGRTIDDADGLARADLDAWRHRASRGRASRHIAFGGVWLDLKLAWRQLTARPAAAVGAASLVAIALAANTAVFVLANGIAWAPLPYPEASRLVTVWQHDASGVGQVSFPDYADFRGASAFEETGVILAGKATLTVDRIAERINQVEVEPSVLHLLGARPVAGRLLTAADAGTPSVLISHRLWRARFNSDASVIGRQIVIGGDRYDVVGVLQPGFDLELPVTPLFSLERNDVWKPFNGSFRERRDISTLEVIARLAPGVDISKAQVILNSVATRLAVSEAATNRNRGFDIVDFRDRVVERARRPLWLSLAGALMVLLIAIANLTTLAIGRITSRRTELSVRRALGATSWRLGRQLGVESALAAGIGAAAGVPAGAWIAGALAKSDAAHLPRPDSIAFGLQASLYALLLVVVVSIVPMMLALVIERRSRAHGKYSEDGGALGQERIAGRTSQWPRRGLVASEVALALVLSTAAGLLSLTMVRLLQVDPGYATTGRLTLRVSAYQASYPTKAATIGFFTQLTERLRQLPNVGKAAVTFSLPLSGQSTGSRAMAADNPKPTAEQLNVGWQMVSPGYFATVGLPIIAGRDFEPADLDTTQHRTIVSLSTARKLFGDRNPIGLGVSSNSGDVHTVIGVTADIRHGSLADPAEPRVYDLFGQHWSSTMFVVVAAKPGVASSTLQPSVERAIAEADPNVPVFDVSTIESLVGRSVASRSLAAIIAGALAAVAVALAVIGTFALVSCAVAERIRELGVRIALGATSQQVVRMILTDALATAGAGSIAGIAGGFAAARMLQTYLYGARTSDGLWLGGLLMGLLIVASVAAAWLPARRAASVDPLVAMRHQG